MRVLRFWEKPRPRTSDGLSRWVFAHRVIEIIKANNRRARELDEPCTLTMDAWEFTNWIFGTWCAYCQSAPGKVVEHAIPIGRSVGTTPINCVPACGACNSNKGELSVFDQKLIRRWAGTNREEGLRNVQQWLLIDGIDPKSVPDLPRWRRA